MGELVRTRLTWRNWPITTPGCGVSIAMAHRSYCYKCKLKMMWFNDSAFDSMDDEEEKTKIKKDILEHGWKTQTETTSRIYWSSLTPYNRCDARAELAMATDQDRNVSFTRQVPVDGVATQLQTT